MQGAFSGTLALAPGTWDVQLTPKFREQDPVSAA